MSLAAIWREARELIPDLARVDIKRSFAGNRAQLVSRDGRLVDDILIRESEHAVHVLNAVSPGLTCSLPFGEYVAKLCQQKLNGTTSSLASPSPPTRDLSAESGLSPDS